MRQSTAFIVAFAVSALAALPASAGSSAYTKIDFKACKTLSEDDLGVTMKCPGYRNYPVYFTEGDLRQSMRYGFAADDLVNESFESFGNFNTVNTTIEWRLDDKGRPYAAIQRWFIDHIDQDTGMSSPKDGGQVLVVSRVAQPEDGLSCVVGYVDALANADANGLARKVADDEAAGFACGYQEAMWEGERGERAGETMHSLPDRLKVE